MSRPLLPAADPAPDYATARARIEALRGQDDAAVNSVCATTLYDHGGPTRRAVVCYHGYTNCPAQFHTLAQYFHAAGDTVLLPRLPHHGRSDRLCLDQARLTAAELVRMTSQTIDIAHGLGDQVILLGLSAGAVMAAWAGQFRADVDSVVVIAPSLGLPGWPVWAGDAAGWLMRRMPNLFIWWDQKAKANILGAPHAYPRFATRSLGEIIALGWEVRRAAAQHPPAAKRLAVIASEADQAVHRGLVSRLAQDWMRQAPDRVSYHTFPAHLLVHHDMIDPTQPNQRIDLVYPLLQQMALGTSLTDV